MTSWLASPMVGFDLESTGTDVFADRIVTASVVHVKPGDRPRSIEWLLDPGIDIPTEATQVHGWTRTRILSEVGGEGRAIRRTPGPDGEGHNRLYMPVDGALGEIAGQLAVALHAQAPIVAANAAFDFSLLEVELDRHDIDPLSSRPTPIVGVVDPMVLDKQWDPYRKSCYKAPGCRPSDDYHECAGCRGGKHPCGGCGVTNRRLGSLCRHYGVQLTAAHSAAADALAAVRLARRLGDLWPDVARLRLPTLHNHQVTWRAEQMASLEAWHRKSGLLDGDYDRGWPRHTSLTSTRQEISA